MAKMDFAFDAMLEVRAKNIMLDYKDRDEVACLT